MYKLLKGYINYNRKLYINDYYTIKNWIRIYGCIIYYIVLLI